MDVVVYDDEDRRYVPARVALMLLVVVALLATGLSVLFTGHRGAAAGAQGPAAPAVGTSAPEAGQAPRATGRPCLDAIAKADAALQRAKAVSATLSAQTTAVDDLLARRITGEQLLSRSLPALTASATDRRRFEEELASYQRARAGCGTGVDDGTGG